MSSLSEIENFVAKLPNDDFSKFREWFWEYENEKWDGQIENDIANKKPEQLSSGAITDLKIAIIRTYGVLYCSFLLGMLPSSPFGCIRTN